MTPGGGPGPSPSPFPSLPDLLSGHPAGETLSLPCSCPPLALGKPLGRSLNEWGGERSCRGGQCWQAQLGTVHSTGSEGCRLGSRGKVSMAMLGACFPFTT